MTITGLQMPSTDTRAGRMVEDSANILKRFYFLQRALVIMQAGWMPGTEHWQSKLLLPEFLWQDSLIAADLRQRVLELRYPERRIAPDQDAPLLALWQRMGDAPDGFAFVEGMSQVIRPMLAEAHRSYLETADHLDDGPTVRILRQALEDAGEQEARWGEATSAARAAYPEALAATRRWVEGLRELSVRLQPALTAWPPEGDLPAFDPETSGGRAFGIAREGTRDRHFTLAAFAWPDRLDPANGPGEGLELQVRQAVHHVNEVWAAEMAAACIYDLADAGPSEFLTDAARWCYDEIRHCRMGYSRLRQWGFQDGEMPLDAFSYDAGARSDALTRLGIIFYFESTYIHTKWQRFRLFGEAGDRVSSHDMDFDWADEQIHTHYGTKWLEYFLRAQGDNRRPVDFKSDAEAAVRDIRARATGDEARIANEIRERTLAQARELAVRTA